DLFGGLPKPLVEKVVYGETGPKILMLQVEGMIREGSGARSMLGFAEEGMLARLREELDRAREDDEIRAILLRINSPGGTVTASDILYHEILRFKREQKIPVIAQLMGVAASGGYYVAMAADEIVAHPTTVTGSIGVIWANVNIAGLMEKFGIEDQTIRTGPFKDAGSMLRPMRPEERAQLQSVLNDMFNRFKEVVGRGRRELSSKQIDELADGRIFSAKQALENGLVDAVGSLEDAVERAQTRAGIGKSRVVTYHRPDEYRQNLYTRMPPVEIALRLPSPWPEIRGPAFLYLWSPGSY
ncbi:MAG: signal peptide peptidase SppA, partial [Myxococcales bacterium]|nr:signal peptide peptidase SppA [Myxococcales bacterium]